MAWRKMTWAYVAGFLDGEGCINVVAEQAGKRTDKRVRRAYIGEGR